MEKGNCHNLTKFNEKNPITFNEINPINTAQETSRQPQTLVESKMIQAFGVPLLNTDGGPRNDFWGKIWERVIRLRGKQYRLPGGALG
jgi:hypothetical protein